MAGILAEGPSADGCFACHKLPGHSICEPGTNHQSAAGWEAQKNMSCFGKFSSCSTTDATRVADPLRPGNNDPFRRRQQ